jgi:molecular chaperone HscA
MALLQISEPGQSTAPHQHRLAAGIDLGTTNSLVASVRSGEAQTLADDDGQHLLASVVRYFDSGETEVGQSARDAALTDPHNTIISVKRFMGRGLDDILKDESGYEFVSTDSAVPRIHTCAGDVSAVEVSAEILKKLNERAITTLGDELAGVVITVPAYFDEAQRQATKDAATIAGLKVLRLLNEPTAAAVAYGLDHGAEGIHVVYDLGGGTFDISVLRLNKGVFEVLSTAGDSALGGDDIDRVIAHWLAEKVCVSDYDAAMHRQLMHVAREAKEALTTQESVDLVVSLFDGSIWEEKLNRETFNELVDPLISKTLAPCRRALRDAGIEAEDVQDIVMVGGSTRTPRVRERVGDFFGKPVLVSIDPDKVVAIGAAIQADILAGNQPDEEMLLLDVNPLSLGIETMGGLFEKIIPRNTTIPVARAQEFTTYKDGQTAMAIHVLQGERELVEDCRSLARFELRGIPPMVAGAARIRVTYQVDADGLLEVSAKELTSGVESSIQVKPSFGLTDNEIENMLKDNFAHADEDVAARNLREQQVEADRVIEAITAALNENGETLLSAEEQDAIQQTMEHLRSTRNGDDHKAIKLAIEAVDKATTDFAARRMDASINKAMSGHKLDEFIQD